MYICLTFRYRTLRTLTSSLFVLGAQSPRVVCDAYFESKQILIMGVLRGVDKMCRKASAIAESSAVLLVSTVAPRCSGSAGVMDTGPYS